MSGNKPKHTYTKYYISDLHSSVTAVVTAITAANSPYGEGIKPAKTAQLLQSPDNHLSSDISPGFQSSENFPTFQGSTGTDFEQSSESDYIPSALDSILINSIFYGDTYSFKKVA